MAYVRLKPYNPKSGALMKTYTAPWGTRFTAGQWCEVLDPEGVAYLARIHERPGDTRTPKAFDVCASLADAQELLRRERLAGLEQVRTPILPRTNPAPKSVEVLPADELNAPPVTHALEVEAAPAPVSYPPEAPEAPEADAPLDLGNAPGSPPPRRRPGGRRSRG